jgi:16S rRNA processing protein RimM
LSYLEHLLKVGKIKEPFGLKGHVRVFLFANDYSWFDQISKIFVLDKEGRPTELTISDYRIDQKGAVVLFKEVCDRTQAEQVVGAELHLEKDFFKSADHEKPYLIELLNFKVLDRTTGEIGYIKSFNSNGIQDLLVVALTSQSDVLVEIPFVDNYVVKLNREEKVIELDLPEGLLEINLK